MTWLLSLFSDWKVIALAIAAAALLAAGLLLRHEVAVNGALQAGLAVSEQTARDNAAAAQRIAADAARDMAALQTQLAAEKARTSTVETITKVIHDAPKDAVCEDRPARADSAGDRAYQCLRDPDRCAQDGSGAGKRSGPVH